MLGGKKDIEKILGSGWNTEGRLETAGLTVIRRTAAASGYCKSISKSCEGIAADEPTGNLDEEIADEIIKILMKSAHEMGKSVIVVTHSKKIS